MNGDKSVLLLSDDGKADRSAGDPVRPDQTAAGAEAHGATGFVPCRQLLCADISGKIKTPAGWTARADGNDARAMQTNPLSL